MNSDYYMILCNKASIEYKNEEPDKMITVDTNPVCTLIIKHCVLICGNSEKYCFDSDKLCCEYYNNINIKNDSIIDVVNLYIKISLPEEYCFVEDSLIVGDEIINNDSSGEIFIKIDRLLPKQYVPIYFMTVKDNFIRVDNNILANINVKYYCQGYPSDQFEEEYILRSC